MKYQALLLLSALTMVGCGSDDSNDVRVLRVGVIAPLNSGLTEFGRGIRNSVQLAVNQVNASGQFPDTVFQVDARDDSSDATTGQLAAESLVNDDNLVGVVGTYNSGVAAAVQPVLDSAGVVMISPGNTNPSLTLGPNLAAPVRPHRNYFRLVVPDTLQGQVLASYAYSTLGKRRVALVSENKAVSLALVDSFAASFTQLGGTISIRAVEPDGSSDFSGLVADVKASQPELIVYGGEFATAAPFRSQASTQGLVVPLMGSDGLKDASYVAGAGSVSEGDYASSLGAPLTAQPGGAAFLSAYSAAGFAEAPSDFGAYAYDAANLIMGASAGDTNRETVLQNVQATQASGVTGRLAFDGFGDTLNRVVTVYQVQNGAFVARSTVTLP